MYNYLFTKKGHGYDDVFSVAMKFNNQMGYHVEYVVSNLNKTKKQSNRLFQNYIFIF
jgi:hypothetical protein